MPPAMNADLESNAMLDTLPIKDSDTDTIAVL
jgi:hypothetical protein